MKISVIQMMVSGDKKCDLDRAQALVRRAAAEGADVAILPEMFCCPYSTGQFRSYGEEAGGEIWTTLSRLAEELGIWLVGGSFPELEGERVYNTCFVFDRQGRQAARHRKAHLFDVDIRGGQYFKESDVLSPGEEVTVFDTEFGAVGLCICFDLRFPELSRAMADRGARLIIVPAAFNMTTGPAHWELLFRQRAADNQLFTIGAAPARNEQAEYISYANSIAADPWGTVIARAGTGEEILTVEPELSRVEEIRAQLPILSARRPHLYR